MVDKKQEFCNSCSAPLVFVLNKKGKGQTGHCHKCDGEPAKVECPNCTSPMDRDESDATEVQFWEEKVRHYCTECGTVIDNNGVQLEGPEEDSYDSAEFWDHSYDEDLSDDFADPGGNSALRAATPSNPRNLPCPTCKQPNRLTPKDRALGYQCDSCADKAERGYDGY